MTASITESVWYLTRPDGTRFHVRAVCGDAPRAMVAIFHGLSEHSGRHIETMRFLASKGFVVIAHDMRGHGLSGGRRGDIVSFEHLFEDAVCVIARAHTRMAPCLPIFILGHSMGGLIALHLMRRFPGIADALMLSSPAIRPTPAIPSWLVPLLKRLSLIVPRVRIASNIPATWLSNDPSVVEAFDHDPLVQKRIALRTGRELLDYATTAVATAREVSCPVLVVQERGDRVCNAHGTEEAFEAFPTTNKRLVMVDGAYHEPLNDLIKDVIRDEIAAWIDHQLTHILSYDAGHPHISYHAPGCTCRETNDFGQLIAVANRPQLR